MHAPLRGCYFLLLAGSTVCGGFAQAATVANDDSYQTGQGQALTIGAPGVLGNDTGDGGTLTASPVNSPMHGTLTLHEDGSFTYDPDDEFYGSDDFSYSASDGSTSDDAIVTLNVTSSYNPGGGGGGYGSGGAPSATTLLLLALAAAYRRGVKPAKRRAISP